MWTPTGFWVLWLRLDSAHEDPCGGGGGVRDISVPQFGPSPCGLCGPPVSLSLEVTGFPHPRNLWCLRLMATAPSPCLSDLSVLTLPPLLAQGVALFLVVPYICPCFINSSLR